jgi:hypothetical protein
MIRIYNTIIREDIQDQEVQNFDEARRALVHKLALHCGLTLQGLTGMPDAEEAFDGDFTQASRLLTYLIGWGLGGFKVSATTRDEYLKVVDLYNGISPVEVYMISEAAARHQEASKQADATLRLQRAPDEERFEARVKRYSDGLS